MRDSSRPGAPIARPDMRIGGVVLAAGLSSRFGGSKPKQLHRYDDETLVRRAVRTALAASLDPLVIVVGHAAEQVRSEVADLEAAFAFNPGYASGQASSVRVGLEAIIGSGQELDGAMFLPIDQPLLDVDTIERLIAAHGEMGPAARRHAVVPTVRGRRGAPVLFGAELFDALSSLEGDEGGRRILKSTPEVVVTVELDREQPLLDVDTLSELEQLAARPSHPAGVDG